MESIAAQIELNDLKDYLWNVGDDLNQQLEQNQSNTKRVKNEKWDYKKTKENNNAQQ